MKNKKSAIVFILGILFLVIGLLVFNEHKILQLSSFGISLGLLFYSIVKKDKKGDTNNT